MSIALSLSARLPRLRVMSADQSPSTMTLIVSMLKLPPDSAPTWPMNPRNSSRLWYQPDRWLWPGTCQTMSSAQNSAMRLRSPVASAL